MKSEIDRTPLSLVAQRGHDDTVSFLAAADDVEVD
jgi:hypothetical protein